jgi:glutathione S-transferase
MIKLYGYPRTRSARVAWALEEASAEYEYIPINLQAGEHKKPAFLKINPFGKIPALIDGDLILSESAAICTYIAEKFPAAQLIPNTPQGRAEYFHWLFFVVSELETHLWTAAKHDRILPEDKRVSAVIKTCEWEFAKAATLLSQHLEQHAYLANNEFSAADIVCVSILQWAHHAGFALDDILVAYMNRLSERPALTKARKREAKAI